MNQGRDSLIHRALRLEYVTVPWNVLAAYVAFESIKTLWLKDAPQGSQVGIILSVLSALVMPGLGWAKRKVASRSGSKALAADAMETLVCANLSVILLAGLGLNAFFGGWWTDPVAGLVLLGFIAKEGWEARDESKGEPTAKESWEGLSL